VRSRTARAEAGGGQERREAAAAEAAQEAALGLGVPRIPAEVLPPGEAVARSSSRRDLAHKGHRPSAGVVVASPPGTCRAPSQAVALEALALASPARA